MSTTDGATSATPSTTCIIDRILMDVHELGEMARDLVLAASHDQETGECAGHGIAEVARADQLAAGARCHIEALRAILGDLRGL